MARGICLDTLARILARNHHHLPDGRYRKFSHAQKNILAHLNQGVDSRGICSTRFGLKRIAVPLTLSLSPRRGEHSSALVISSGAIWMSAMELVTPSPDGRGLG